MASLETSGSSSIELPRHPIKNNDYEYTHLKKLSSIPNMHYA